MEPKSFSPPKIKGSQLSAPKTGKPIPPTNDLHPVGDNSLQAVIQDLEVKTEASLAEARKMLSGAEKKLQGAMAKIQTRLKDTMDMADGTHIGEIRRTFDMASEAVKAVDQFNKRVDEITNGN